MGLEKYMPTAKYRVGQVVWIQREGRIEHHAIHECFMGEGYRGLIYRLIDKGPSHYREEDLYETEQEAVAEARSYIDRLTNALPAKQDRP